MGLFKAKKFRAKEDKKEFILFEPTVNRKGSFNIPNKLTPSKTDNESFALTPKDAKKRFKRSFF